MYTKIHLLACFIFYSFSSHIFALEHITGEVDTTVIQRIRALLDTPEDNIDFTHAKLSIDKEMAIHNVKYDYQRINHMVEKIKAMMGNAKTATEKKDVLRRFLYEKGRWNYNKPFTYDFADPKGTNIKNKMINTYLRHKKGNCVSMPFLFLMLAQKLGLNVTASTAPLHVFVKFTDEKGKTINLETTSGANPARDSWIRKHFPISNKALKNGLYLQKLSKKETVAVMVEQLMQHYAEKKQFGTVIALADLILEYHPKNMSAFLYKASSYNKLLKVHGLWQYRDLEEVPEHLRSTYKYLIFHEHKYYNHMVSLGWQPVK